MSLSDIKSTPILYNSFLIQGTTIQNFKKANIEKKIEKIYEDLKSLNEKKENIKYLCLSCIFGGFLGDSMGSCCEFSEKSPKNHLDIFKIENGIFENGEITDDSEMAISAAFAYIDYLSNQSKINIQDLLYFYYGIWTNSWPKDIGMTVQRALSLFNVKRDSIINAKFSNFIKQNTINCNWNSLANGFLMRISTFIVFFYYNYYNEIIKIFQSEKESDEYLNLYYLIYIESIKNTEITHPNFENAISSALFTFMVLTAFIKKKSKDVIDYLKCLLNNKNFENKIPEIKEYSLNTKIKIKNIFQEIEQNKDFDVFDSMGYYLHAFKLSIFYLYKYNEMENSEKYENKEIPNLYRYIMEDICDRGGDTDTNCAIVGTLIGPLIGYKKFDQKLFEIFIKYFPSKRIQYTSALMYYYVNFLEKNCLKIKNKISEEIINEIVSEENKIEKESNGKENNKTEENEEGGNIKKKKNEGEKKKIEIQEEKKDIEENNKFKFSVFEILLEFLN